MQDAAMSSQVFWFLVHRDLSSVPLLSVGTLPDRGPWAQNSGGPQPCAMLCF